MIIQMVGRMGRRVGLVNMLKMKSAIFCALLFSLLIGCSDLAPQIPYNKIKKENVSDNLLEMNKVFAQIEDSLINDYVGNLDVNVTTTESGLRYYITQKGTGKRVVENGRVTYRYSVRPIDGEPCDKLTNVVKTVQLDRTDIEKGFREALSLLSVNETGQFIMSSYLGYGVVGVPNCIQPWTPVVCEITLLEVEESK